MSESTLVDWSLARRVAKALSDVGRPDGQRVAADELSAAAYRSVGLVASYTGLEPKGELPEPEIVGREEWIDANLVTLRDAAAGIEEKIADQVSESEPGRFGAATRSITRAATGLEVGIAAAYLSQRILGQYDLALIGPARPPRLLFVGPNLAEAQSKLGAERQPFLRWIALHEATHAVQFSSVPWLRPHLGGMAEELLTGATVRIGRDLGPLIGRLLRSDIRELANTVRRGELVTLFLDPERRAIFHRLQAAMAVVEGYSEHVMDAVGAELDPSFGELRERMEHLRDRRTALDSVVGRLLGLDAKLRQYRLGKAFADAVAERQGIEGLNRVWEAPELLPTLEELEHPDRWLKRAGVPSTA